jgi:ParB family chromosome partitioning protein
VIAHGAHLDKAALGGDRRAARLLGFTKDIGGGRYPGDLLAKATSPRAQVIALVVALAAIEDTMSVQCWREPQTGSMNASHLGALEAWGYDLSDIEQTACGRNSRPNEDSGPTQPVEAT